MNNSRFASSLLIEDADVPEQVAMIAIIPGSEDGAEAAGGTLESLVRDHARFVYRVAYSVLRNHHDAEDATQETFLRVLRHERELGAIDDIRAWLARITWRVAVDRRRQMPDEAWLEADANNALEQLRSADTGAEQTAITAQMLEIAQRLIARLPADLRDALTLSTVAEMTSTEIAAVLGIPEASVRTRVFRARQLLKEKLGSLLEGNAV